MAQDLSPGKSACILAVVIGCFAILWPSIFYPMLKGSVIPSTPDRNEYHRQEQSRYLRPNAMHPAIREHGQTIPQPHSVPPPSRERRSIPPPVIAAKKPPIPGLRPPMAGRGHVPSQKDNGPMGILMPLYTVGIIIFFVYTITKLVCKKHDSNTQHLHDPGFHRLVSKKKAKESKQSTNLESSSNISPDISKLVVSAISSLLQEVNHDILKREMKKEQREIQPAEDSTPVSSEKPVANELEEKQSNEKCAEIQATTENSHTVNDLSQVTKVEMSESCTNGQSRIHSSVESTNKSSIPKNKHKEIVGDEIALPTNEPVNSKTSITDSSTRKVGLLEEPSAIGDSKTTMDKIANDSNHKEANSTKENKEDVDDEDEENTRISENNEVKSSEQDSSKKEDILTTKL